MQQWRGWELRNLKSHYVKITDESSCFSLGFLSQNSLWKLSIFRGYEGYLYLCVFGIRRVRFFQNRAGWWLSLAIWLSRKFKPRTNCTFCLVVLRLAWRFNFSTCLAREQLLAACKAWATREIQSWVPATLYKLKHFFTLSHTLPLHDSHLNTRLLIDKLQANLARNKANKMVD